MVMMMIAAMTVMTTMVNAVMTWGAACKEVAKANLS